MLTFIELLEELSNDHVTLNPAEVRRMRDRFGDKALQMGNLEEDGSLSIPVDSMVEAVQSIGSKKLNEAVEKQKSEEMLAMFESAETLVERVAEAQKRKLEQMVAQLQSEPDSAKSHQRWKQIEKLVFGVDYPD